MRLRPEDDPGAKILKVSVRPECFTGAIEQVEWPQRKRYDEFDFGYVLTVHKSQGAEYPAVVIPLHTQHYMMLQRNLLYTGITRGKRLVVLVGSRKALSLAVQRQDTAKRFSLLRQRLAGEPGASATGVRANSGR